MPALFVPFACSLPLSLSVVLASTFLHLLFFHSISLFAAAVAEVPYVEVVTDEAPSAAEVAAEDVPVAEVTTEETPTAEDSTDEPKQA